MPNDDIIALSFQIIAAVGTARSRYIEAIHAARGGDFAKAEQLMAAGNECFSQGHAVHTGLIQREADGDPCMMTLMLTHAEDQLMSAEGFGIIASEFIETHRALQGQAVEPAAEEVAA